MPAPMRKAVSSLATSRQARRATTWRRAFLHRLPGLQKELPAQDLLPAAAPTALAPCSQLRLDPERALGRPAGLHAQAQVPWPVLREGHGAELHGRPGLQGAGLPEQGAVILIDELEPAPPNEWRTYRRNSFHTYFG